MKQWTKSENSLYWRLFLFLYLGGFILGIIFCNLTWRYHIRDVESLREGVVLEKFETGVEKGKFFEYLLFARAGMPLLLIFLGITILGTIAVAVLLLWYGFLAGILLTAALFQMGIRGVGYLLVGMFPQMLVYVPVTAALLLIVCQMSQKFWRPREQTVKRYLRYFLQCFTLFALYLWGILLESYINPVILKHFF